MPHAIGRPERHAVDDDLASMFDFIYEHAPRELAVWVKEIRAKMVQSREKRPDPSR